MTNIADLLPTLVVISTSVVAVEQVLAQCDSIKSNSTFQLICNITDFFVSTLKNLGTKKPPTDTSPKA
jgi:hypothetical protein